MIQGAFPPGICFAPTDEELIIHYLRKKMKDEPVACDCICSINIYQYNPWELTEMYPSLRKDEWYFFTSRDRKYANGSRPNRAAGVGYWKATAADKKIYDNNDCIGFKKTLVFYEGKAPNCKKTNWIMHEYTVDHPPRHPTDTNDNMRLDNCVLCRIHERKTIHEPNLPMHWNLPQQHIQGQRNLQVQPPNLLMQPQNLQAVQYSLMVVGNHNFGRQLGYHLESAPETARQIHYDHPENGLETFPPGICFAPTDEELIVHYLRKKVKNEPVAYDCICSVNVYKYNPCELTEMYPSLRKDEWYFFTSRERKYLNGSRPNRAAGDGYWKATVADQRIYDNNDCIGFKKTLVFYQGKAPNDKKTNWIMHEYTVDHPPRHPIGTNDNMRLDNCVLCRIHERKQADSRKTITCNLQVQPPNLPMQQQNLQATQYSLMAAGNHNLGGQLDYHLQSVAGDARQIRYDHPGNGLEAFNDLISLDMIFDSGFGDFTLPDQNFNDFDPFALMDCFEPNPPSFNNNDQNFNDFDPYALVDSFEPNPPSFDSNDHPQDAWPLISF